MVGHRGDPAASLAPGLSLELLVTEGKPLSRVVVVGGFSVSLLCLS